MKIDLKAAQRDTNAKPRVEVRPQALPFVLNQAQIRLGQMLTRDHRAGMSYFEATVSVIAVNRAIASKPMFSRPLPGWPTPPPEVRWGLREAFLCLVGAQFGGLISAMIVLGAASSLGFDVESLEVLLASTIGLWIGYFFGPAAFSKSLGQGPRVDFDIGIDLREAAAAVFAGVALQLALLPVLYWPITKVVDADPGDQAREILDKVDGPFDVAILALAVVLIAPVVEERYYRGMLLPALTRSSGMVVGILGSSMIFALVHQAWILIPGLALLAAVLSWMTITTGRIGPAIVTHMAFNASSVIGSFLLS